MPSATVNTGLVDEIRRACLRLEEPFTVDDVLAELPHEYSSADKARAAITLMAHEGELLRLTDPRRNRIVQRFERARLKPTADERRSAVEALRFAAAEIDRLVRGWTARRAQEARAA